MKIKRESNEDYLGGIMSKEEQHLYFDEMCYRVIHNTRFYLDNLDRLYTCRLSITSEIYGFRHHTRLTKDNLYKGRS
jgi:hypothetical protein